MQIMKKIGQKQIAKVAKISPSYFSQILSKSRTPTYWVAKRLMFAVPNTTAELWLEGTEKELRAAVEQAIKSKEAA
jgi:transcriptional regulator with XRE-family HTH domain